ncbi:MAG TPA: M13 family metallopeptidase [Gemmatimonadaceae bacterium]|nr:M13 family metallopeptidase [Gemmatimonadaceae bacterium]
MPSPIRATVTSLLEFLTFATACGGKADTFSSIVPLGRLKVIDTSYIDKSAKACTDFFQYANGAWLARDTIPAAYSSSGTGRDMTDENEVVLHSVLDDVMAKRASIPADSATHKLGTFYASCMDSTAADAAGITPIKPELDSIDHVETREALLDEIAILQEGGLDVAFDYSPDVDAHDATHYMAWFYQGGLGLPDRDYYTKKGAASDSTRRDYVAHISTLMTLAGEAPAAADSDAQRVMTLETALATASMTRVEQRDPSAIDHPMPMQQLRTLAPNVDWTAYFKDIGLTSPVSRLNVAQPAFMQRVSSLLASTPIQTWRAYLRYHAVAAAAPWLSTPFVNEDFAFDSKFNGAKTLLPRWKRCAHAADADMGEALGEAYVERTFTPQARALAKAIIDNVRAAFRDRIASVAWMSDSTKKYALDKLAKMREKVGYPDHWRDYTKLVVSDGPFVLNVRRADAFEWRRVVNRPGMPVDTTEWDMTVPTVNAYYDGSKNEMVFPAGALIPQTFDAKADAAANYGSLGGGWAGHEETHGFDDEGRHYDADGNLKDWWTKADSAHFAQQAALMVKQFNGYIQVDTFHVNGELTLGENIADFGGVLTGYDALEAALKRDGRPGLIEGFTPEQRYFLSYAQSWRGQVRPEALKTRVTTDPHSPNRWRVDGPLSDFPAFASAFGCKPGDPMVRPTALVPRIW